MIRSISGKVLSTELTSVVIEVAGFGIEVRTASPDAFTVGSTASLSTHLAVKQDGMELYGFADPLDRDFFELALTVSGIGPKTALALLRRSPREGLESAIARRDIPYLTRVAGLGKKSAEKLAVELSEKLESKKGAGDGNDAEVFDTLVALGYTDREARKALQAVPESVSGKEARLKAALTNGRS
ncbi:MAG TPA: Holliday junction branch migration protein RuvA [Candidatus Paceibacterota bacterium]|nr:Holliday junction branch migration protein RuvA [Candidatus Paceibacterota bacterium]